MDQERKQILNMVEVGNISPEQALQLLDALEDTDSPNGIEKKATPADFPNPGNWWLYPTIAGAVVMAVGAPLMALGLTERVPMLGAICCGWIPFFIGLGILTLGVWSRSARWLHLRVTNTDSGKTNVALSMPLPLTFSAWALKMARPFVPQLKETGIDEAILSLRDGLSEKDSQPVLIDVRDDDDGEHVMIYIG